MMYFEVFAWLMMVQNLVMSSVHLLPCIIIKTFKSSILHSAKDARGRGRGRGLLKCLAICSKAISIILYRDNAGGPKTGHLNAKEKIKANLGDKSKKFCCCFATIA